MVLSRFGSLIFQGLDCALSRFATAFQGWLLVLSWFGSVGFQWICNSFQWINSIFQGLDSTGDLRFFKEHFRAFKGLGFVGFSNVGSIELYAGW
jgi:hypothetical protein